MEIKKVRTSGPANDFKVRSVSFFTVYLAEKRRVQVSNLTFSEEELSALQNRRFFELKSSITKTMMREFSELETSIKHELEKLGGQVAGLPEQSGKIFRGENYKGFPYIVLDYPRSFNSKSVFAFRSMFWWGNGFSFTIHLQGEALEEQRAHLLSNWKNLKNKSFLICVNNTPWEYHFGDDNYRELEGFSEQEIEDKIRTDGFLKFSRKMDTNSYREILSFGTETFRLLIEEIRNR